MTVLFCDFIINKTENISNKT